MVEKAKWIGILGGITLLISGGWRGCQSPEDQILEVRREPLVFESIASGTQAALKDTIEQVVYDTLTWNQWRMHFQAEAPLPIPDFSQVMTGIVALPVPGAGYWLRINTVEKVGDRIEVNYTLFEPEPGCITAAVETVPYQIVAIRRVVDIPVTFKRQVEYVDCAF